MSEHHSDADQPSRVGKFIQTYHSFLSTFVIGAAGLIATSTWQYKQSEISRTQASSQLEIAQKQAENNWRIERAEILSKNLQVLASSGENTAEQRYGVLLSLTRGNILDTELTVSYALELGKDNAEYMKSVLQNTPGKNYTRLATAFELTCYQRFGESRDVALCKTDALAARSQAIADLFEDETVDARKAGQPGPMVLLTDERDVKAAPARMAALFTPYLSTLYERRQWNEISNFEAFSSGAKLVAALVLGPAKLHELVASSEVADIDKFHDLRIGWLIDFATGAACDPDCKAKITDIFLTDHVVAMGRFDRALRAILKRPRPEISFAVGRRLHTRLLACQVDSDDLPAIRDDILVPALTDALGETPADPKRIEELLNLIVLVPDPKPAANGGNAAAANAWNQAIDKSRAVLKDAFRAAFTARRAAAQYTRRNPTLAQKAGMFCSEPEVVAVDDDFAE